MTEEYKKRTSRPAGFESLEDYKKRQFNPRKEMGHGTLKLSPAEQEKYDEQKKREKERDEAKAKVRSVIGMLDES